MRTDRQSRETAGRQEIATKHTSRHAGIQQGAQQTPAGRREGRLHDKQAVQDDRTTTQKGDRQTCLMESKEGTEM